MYDHDHPACRKLQEVGQEITSKVKPRAVVVFSSHWHASRDTVEVNNAEITELMYDGFLTFGPDQNPLNVPIVQVSLFKTEDPIQHYRLGQAVAKLREENIQIIVSGMAVHNLRDLRFT
ncbi:hypothetical protein ACJ73_05371 [Blastomyces percursus]|uniref:Extradiol ring-cleavage dioxygenase class III enzyme subunit B domain-containing protein n=1 Tax=Blastomyces percursus TaxID=1658174 RepID=A0A1J9R5I8_9EURO|nr:hypothetical protein ACJ73_05371 [Blastomyces percursus]